MQLSASIALKSLSHYSLLIPQSTDNGTAIASTTQVGTKQKTRGCLFSIVIASNFLRKRIRVHRLALHKQQE